MFTAGIFEQRQNCNDKNAGRYLQRIKTSLRKYGILKTPDRFLQSGVFWWSKTVNIRTESCDVGSFFTCHNHNRFIAECRLNEYLHKVDLEANEMLESIILRFDTERGIDENLKARYMLCWVAKMNNIKASAEGIVLLEVMLA